MKELLEVALLFDRSPLMLIFVNFPEGGGPGQIGTSGGELPHESVTPSP